MHGESHHAQRTEDATNDDGLGYCLQTVQPLVVLLLFFFIFHVFLPLLARENRTILCETEWEVDSLARSSSVFKIFNFSVVHQTVA